MALNNRYEFMFYIEVVNGNPNGDPDMGNAPRMDPEDRHGYITDVAIKRRIRNYIQRAYDGYDGMEIIMKNATIINKEIARAKEMSDTDSSIKIRDAVYRARQKACQLFYDVRTFGAVLSVGPNAGQVRGPVQLTFATSLDEIQQADITITRMCKDSELKKDKKKDNERSYEEYLEEEQNIPEKDCRTMGRKQFIPYGLYESKGFISANLACETGFDEEDLKRLFEAILNMYEHDRSASKGMMTVISPLIIFKHVGTDSCEEQRIRQAKLGCASAQQLFSLVHAEKKADVAYPRSIDDYTISVHADAVPNGVEIGFLSSPYDEISWGSLPNSTCNAVKLYE